MVLSSKDSLTMSVFGDCEKVRLEVQRSLRHFTILWPSEDIRYYGLSDQELQPQNLSEFLL